MIIGNGWVKKDKDDNKYLSCYIEIIGMKFYFNLFHVKEKKSENAPDYNIVTYIKDNKNDS
jgi:uncharacterized protein (DUF736 family)